VADALRKKPGFEVQLVDGGRGELTVLVNGQEVARKQGDRLPTVDEVIAAVKKPGAAASGAHT